MSSTAKTLSNSQTEGIPYDFASIMHCDFDKENGRTPLGNSLYAAQNKREIGYFPLAKQPKGASQLDKVGLSALCSGAGFKTPAASNCSSRTRGASMGRNSTTHTVQKAWAPWKTAQKSACPTPSAATLAGASTRTTTRTNAALSVPKAAPRRTRTARAISTSTVPSSGDVCSKLQPGRSIRQRCTVQPNRPLQHGRVWHVMGLDRDSMRCQRRRLRRLLPEASQRSCHLRRLQNAHTKHKGIGTLVVHRRGLRRVSQCGARANGNHESWATQFNRGAQLMNGAQHSKPSSASRTSTAHRCIGGP